MLDKRQQKGPYGAMSSTNHLLLDGRALLDAEREPAFFLLEDVYL